MTRILLALLFGSLCFVLGAYLPRACAATPPAPQVPTAPVSCESQLAETRTELRHVRWYLDVEKRALAATCLRLHEAGEYSVICDNGAR